MGRAAASGLISGLNEEIDKAIIVKDPDVFRQWKGDATDRRSIATTVPRCLRISALSGGEVFGLVSTECLSADKDPSSPHRDSGVRFGPMYEGRIAAPVMGSFTAGAAPGFPRGRWIGWDRAKPPAYNYQVSSRRDALRSSPSSDTL